MIAMQKQAARNLVLSPNAQATYGELMADAYLSRRVQFDASSVLEKMPDRASDQKDVGKGTEFATNGQITGWDTKMTLKKDLDQWWAGWALAFLFGQSVDTGAGPYNHLFTFPNIDATLVPTCIYCEETAPVKYKAQDMCVNDFSLTVPSRGRLSASASLVGTGRWTPGAMAGGPPALPTLVPTDYLLGSDMILTITPSGGGATIFSGRVLSATVKLDNQGAPYKSTGDGLYAGSVNSGTRKHSLDVQIAALVTDDVNGWFEGDTECNVSFATNNALSAQIGFNWPYAHIKANKLGNQKDLVVWSLSFDETTCYAKNGYPAVSAFVLNNVASYLIPE